MGSTVGFTLPGYQSTTWFSAQPPTWLAFEHLFFWISVALFAGFGIVAVVFADGKRDAV
jgi:hypothetical protein